MIFFSKIKFLEYFMFSLSPKTYFVETFKLLIEAKTKVASVFAFDNCLFGNNCLAFYFTTGRL